MKPDEILLNKIATYLNLRFPVAEFARDLGYSKSAVSNYMNGKKPVSRNFIRAIENHYKINVNDFKGGRTPINGALSMSRVKEIASFIAINQDELMKDPLFRTVVESLFLRREISRIKEGP